MNDSRDVSKKKWPIMGQLSVFFSLKTASTSLPFYLITIIIIVSVVSEER